MQTPNTYDKCYDLITSVLKNFWKWSIIYLGQSLRTLWCCWKLHIFYWHHRYKKLLHIQIFILFLYILRCLKICFLPLMCVSPLHPSTCVFCIGNNVDKVPDFCSVQIMLCNFGTTYDIFCCDWYIAVQSTFWNSLKAISRRMACWFMSSNYCSVNTLSCAFASALVN